MSRPKFAPVTSSLLARKGDARPWQPDFAAAFADGVPRAARESDAEAPPFVAPPVIVPHDNLATLHAAFAPSKHLAAPGLEHSKRCALALSPEEYETLGIVAVKRGISRHLVLRQAFEQYMRTVARELGEGCDCLNGKTCGC